MKLIKGGKRRFNRGDTVMVPDKVAEEVEELGIDGSLMYRAAFVMHSWVVMSSTNVSECYCVGEECDSGPDCGPDIRYQLARTGEPSMVKTFSSKFVYDESTTTEDLGLKHCTNCQGWGEIKAIALAAFAARMEGKPVPVESHCCPYCEGCGFLERADEPNIDDYDERHRRGIQKMRDAEAGRKYRGQAPFRIGVDNGDLEA